MSDTKLNRFLASGTAAQRAAFTPDPAAPISGPNPTYLWWETDTAKLYAWNYGAAAWNLVTPRGFLSLSDVPSAYTGGAGKVVAVNATEDGLEFISGGAGGSVPDAISKQGYWPPSSPDTMDDEFDTDGSIDTSKWTWVNQSTRTAVRAKSWLNLEFVSTGSGDKWGHVVQTPPATPWTFETRLQYDGSTGSNFIYGGMIARNSGSSKFLSWKLDNSSLGYTRWNSETSFSANVAATNYGTWPAKQRGDPIYLRLENDGTNLKAHYSYDGAHFRQFASDPLASFVSSVDQIGLGVGTNIGTGTASFRFDYFRRIA